MKRALVLVLMVVLGATAAQAAVVGVAGGTGAPAATLGPYTMTPFGADPSPELTDVTSVASPLGGSVGFDIAMSHRRIGSSWATWSNGYTGDVYYTNGATGVTMTMPAGTGAFYFYAETNPFGLYDIVATASDGTTVSQTVDGFGGAAYYGFYGTGGDLLSTIAVNTSVDFAVGEFGIGVVPLPGAALLASIGLGYAGMRLRRRTA